MQLESLFKIIFFFTGIGLIFYYAVLWDNDRKWVKTQGIKKQQTDFLRISITFSILFFLFVLSLLLPDLQIPDPDRTILLVFSIFLSLLTSLAWYRYLSGLDIFEKEKFRYILLTFLLSCASIYLVFPLSEYLESTYEFHLNGDFWNDWWYCVLGIGLVEETVKILPIIIVLKLTKQINEPIDYLVYGAVSALGFAFIENIQYLERTNLMALEGRVLYSSLAHMIFTSTITYGLVMKNRIAKKWRPFIFPTTLLLAAFAHGFYDFWLINPLAKKYSIFTLIFMLISIKWWLVMTSNLINISPHFNYKQRHTVRFFKYRLLNFFIFIFIVEIVLVNLINGQKQMEDFFYISFFNGAFFMLLFVTINLNGIQIIKNYIHPFKLPTKIKDLFLPHLTFQNNIIGQRMTIAHRKIKPGMNPSKEILKNLPLKGEIVRRLVLGNHKDWFLFEVNPPFIYNQQVVYFLYIRSEITEDHLNESQYYGLEARLPKGIVDLDKPTFNLENTIKISNLVSKKSPSQT